MPLYIIPWTMAGDVEIEAATSSEAQLKFDRMSFEDIGATCADDGLYNGDPKTAEELDNEFQNWRTSGDSALDNLLREQIAQEIEGEKRNG
jgi:hypothetical protein